MKRSYTEMTLTNDEGETATFMVNRDGTGYILRVGGEDFWIEDLDDFEDAVREWRMMLKETG